MAEGVISAVVDVTLTKAISILEKQINLRWGFKGELDKLCNSLNMTRAFLRDAEGTQVDGRRQVDGEAVKLWLNQLTKVASEADDVLDDLAYEDLRRKVETQMKQKVCNFFSISKNPILFCCSMPSKVKGINTSLKEINAEARDFGLQQRVQIQNVTPLSGRSQATHSVGDTSQFSEEKLISQMSLIC